MKRLGTMAMLAAICAAFIGVVPASGARPCPVTTDLVLGKNCGYHVRMRDLPLRFEYNATAAPVLTAGGLSLKASVVRDAIDGAILAWNTAWPVKSSDPTCPALCYQGSTSLPAGIRDGHNVIAFGDPSQACGVGDTAAAVACAWYAGDTGSDRLRIKEIDIILNRDAKWAQPFAGSADAAAGEIYGALGLSAKPWMDVQSVLTHELGHALGLEHPGPEGSDYPTDASQAGFAIQTMYWKAVGGATNKRTLEAGDIAALNYVAMLTFNDR